MILQCPKCSVKFLVPDKAIGDGGRDVRCGKCGHVWFAVVEETPQRQEMQATETEQVEAAAGGGGVEENPAAAIGEETGGAVESEESKESEEDNDIKEFASDAEELPIPEGSGLPMVVEKSAAPPAMIAAVIAMLLVDMLLGLITFRDDLQPLLPWVYSPLGIYATSGVAISDFEFEQRALGKKKRITLGCTIVNNSDEVRRVPALKAQILNAEGGVLGKESNLLQEGRLMKPKEQYPCGKIRMTNPFSSATTMVLDLGNPFELGLRE